MMLVRLPYPLLFLFAAILSSARGEQNEKWLFPGHKSRPVYNYLDTVNASWTSTYNPPTLFLWCRNSTAGAIDQSYSIKFQSQVAQTGYELVPLNYNSGPLECHFTVYSANAMKNSKRLVPTFNSGPITVEVKLGQRPVTWSSNNAGQAPTASGSQTASQTGPSVYPSATSTSPTASTSATSSGISTGTRVGIGIGVAAGLLAIVAAIAVLVFLWKRRRRRLLFATTAHKSPIDMSSELQSNDPSSEVEASPRHELPASSA